MLANLLEIEEIRHYNCVASNGYNLTRCGDGTSGFVPSAEWRKKQSEAKRGNQNAKGLIVSEEKREADRQRMLGNKLGKGYKHTDEWKREESKRRKGIKRPNQSKFMKENNPMKRIDVKISCLKNHIAKLEGTF